MPSFPESASACPSATRQVSRSPTLLRSARTNKSLVVDLYASAPSQVHSARRVSRCAASVAPRAPFAKSASHRSALTRRRSSRPVGTVRAPRCEVPGEVPDLTCDAAIEPNQRSTRVAPTGSSNASNTSCLVASADSVSLDETSISPNPRATSARWRLRRDAACERHVTTASAAVRPSSPSNASGSGMARDLARDATSAPARLMIATRFLGVATAFGADETFSVSFATTDFHESRNDTVSSCQRSPRCHSRRGRFSRPNRSRGFRGG